MHSGTLRGKKKEREENSVSVPFFQCQLRSRFMRSLEALFELHSLGHGGGSGEGGLVGWYRMYITRFFPRRLLSEGEGKVTRDDDENSPKAPLKKYSVKFSPTLF